MSWKTLGLRRVSERTKKTCNLHAMLYSSQVCWLDRLVVIFATPHFSQWGCSWRATFVGGCVNLRREALPGCVLCLWDLLGFFFPHQGCEWSRGKKSGVCGAQGIIY